MFNIKYYQICNKKTSNPYTCSPLIFDKLVMMILPVLGLELTVLGLELTVLAVVMTEMKLTPTDDN